MSASGLDAESLIGPRPRLTTRTGHDSGQPQASLTPAYPLAEIAPELCEQLLERVIQSRELKRAVRLRELLCFLGKRSLMSHPGVLREQEIGAALFGRPEEYDTNLDNIVRVNVSELRKRLARYFEGEGAHESMTIEIPRGGYFPLFLPRPVQPLPVPALLDRPEEQLAAKGENASTAVLQTLAADTEQARLDARAVVLAPSGDGARLGRPGLVMLLSTGLLVALLYVAWLAWRSQNLVAQPPPWRADPMLASFWSEFFASNQDVDIVTADSSFALAEDILGSTISLEDYLDYKYKDVIERPGLTPETRTALRLVLDRNNGSIGDFHAAERFRDLDAQSPSVKLESARAYTTENIKTNNVILIGARQSNPWVDLYKEKMNFFMECQPRHQRSYVINRNPAAGEESIYEYPDRSHGYSVVAFLPNLASGRSTLIVSGADSQATRAAGEFVTSSEGLAQIRSRMPSGRFPYFEVVLSSSRLAEATLDTKIVAYRVHAR